MAALNPFTPSFGKIPPYMAGRDLLIEEMTQAFDNGVGDPNLSSILVGPRGTGKTALLLYLARIASSKGWITVSVSAVPGMLEDIVERTREAAKHLIEVEEDARLTGLNFGQVFGLEWEPASKAEGNWRTRMTRIIEALNERGVGLLITVDEVKVELDEMIQLASVYQHFVGEDRKVALIMAGLPAKVSALLRNDSVSFLRRACRYNLGRIEDGSIEDALRQTIVEGGRTIDADSIDVAVEATAGFPYMMQLVGFRMWNQHPESEAIGLEDAKRGVELAQRDLEQRVLEATYYDLSKGDRRFLEAMLQDGGASELTDIAARLGEGTNYVSTYKKRLLELGVIGIRGRSAVAFELPGFREYFENMQG